MHPYLIFLRISRCVLKILPINTNESATYGFLAKKIYSPSRLLRVIEKKKKKKKKKKNEKYL
jgi:hypothetical protein